MSITNISLKVCDKTYLKDPISSELGKKMLEESINLICDIGFEEFTFKKLACKIGSTEASMYRYFESKHHLLAYLFSWYWSWMEYSVMLKTMNIEDPEVRLRKVIKAITEVIEENTNFLFINEVKLFKIVASESSKVYLNKKVDEVNALGVFKHYKDFIEFVSQIILEINPLYKYPHMLVSTLIEGVHYQRYFTEHLPRLTDVVEGEDAVDVFYNEMVFKLIK
ncbi:MAG: TetR/AcrR family transcriptional regulator [Flavobacteriales bacterium]|nr:TetR/AcrR family transcriptional regulator [Flavobacteriales bacterium]MCB9198297.1 TetR/AcrR family transcriptional regulator [Flavobacteriales bacterium]